MNFYRALKEVCREKNTTPSAVCLALGMSKSNVTTWKKGGSPRLDVVQAIANHIGISGMDLISRYLEG